VRGSLDVPDPRVEQLAGGALEVLAGGPRAPVLGVGGARDRVHDGRLGVARLHVPGPLQPRDHLVGGDAGDVDGAIAYHGLVDGADVIDAVVSVTVEINEIPFDIGLLGLGTRGRKARVALHTDERWRWRPRRGIGGLPIDACGVVSSTIVKEAV